MIHHLKNQLAASSGKVDLMDVLTEVTRHMSNMETNMITSKPAGHAMKIVPVIEHKLLKSYEINTN